MVHGPSPGRKVLVMGRARRISWALLVVGAVLAAVLCAAQAVSAKGPCGKQGARCRLVQDVRVEGITSDGATVVASFTEEAVYTVVLQLKKCPVKKSTCRPHREVVATGTVGGEETLNLGLAVLGERTGYAVRVSATSASRRGGAKPVAFTTS